MSATSRPALLQVETDVSIKTGTVTLASSVIAGYGNALVGYVTKIDIVTPSP